MSIARQVVYLCQRLADIHAAKQPRQTWQCVYEDPISHHNVTSVAVQYFVPKPCKNQRFAVRIPGGLRLRSLVKLHYLDKQSPPI